MTQVIDRFGCLNNTIKVSAGHYVDLANPDPKTIELKSIAAALSKICRFGAHCPFFYSVAEHCIIATGIAKQEGHGGDALRAIFLHDAAEAYIGDMVKPLKTMLPQYSSIESKIESAIGIAFGVDFTRWHETIKTYDRAMLKAEKTTMWPDDTEKWEGFGDVADRNVSFAFWTPDQAERAFLAMAETLQLVW